MPWAGTSVRDRRRPGYRGLAGLAANDMLRLDIQKPPNGASGFTPVAPLCKVERAFARLGLGAGYRAATRAPGEREGVARGRLDRLLLTRFRPPP